MAVRRTAPSVIHFAILGPGLLGHDEFFDLLGFE
jgi:hypothetical protein